MAEVKSPLRWAGSKRSLLPLLRSSIPTSYATYIEPFAGSACLFFSILPERARLSDFNDTLIRFYTALRDEPEDLIEEFDRLRDDGQNYYLVRDAYGSGSAVKAAAEFLYLNRHSFNGVYRTNRSGRFNVPRGVNTGSLPSSDQLRAASSALAGVTLQSSDYREALKDAKKGDFVYIDPPYRNTVRQTYGEYGYGAFGSENDVADLALEITRLDGLGAYVLLSFSDDIGLSDSLHGWTVQSISRKRSVAGNAQSRTVMSDEILACNFQGVREQVG